MRNLLGKRPGRWMAFGCVLVGMGLMAQTPIHAEEKAPSTPTPVSKEAEYLINTMMGVQSYSVDKTKTTKDDVEAIVKTMVQDKEKKEKETLMASQPSMTRMVMPEEKEMTYIETRKTKDAMNETIHEDIYLYGDTLVSIQNFHPNSVGQQKVTVKTTLLSMIEKQLIQTLETTEYMEPAGASETQTLIIDVHDVSAPQIHLSAKKAEVMVGETFDMKKYVKSVTDDTDKNLEWKVEGKVDTSKEGKYGLKILVEDTSGNKTVEDFTVIVKEDLGRRIANKALQYRGYPYVWAATGPNAFDCSGLMQYVYAQFGISIPRTAGAQGAFGRPVSANAMKPGDLVIYGGGNHVAMYIGDGQVVHALNPSVGVTVGAWNTPYNGGVTNIVRIV